MQRRIALLTALLLAAGVLGSAAQKDVSKCAFDGDPCTSNRNRPGLCHSTGLEGDQNYMWACDECPSEGGACDMGCTTGTCYDESPEYDPDGFLCDNVEPTGTPCKDYYVTGLSGTCDACGVCQTSVQSDPVITGFDGKSFHFNSVGEYALLESGDGLKIHVTFAAATTAGVAGDEPETAWTSSVRVISPNGDMVACSLPAILPNTSRVQMTATPADAAREMVLLSPSTPVMTLAELKALAIIKEVSSGTQQVVGCRVATEKVEVVVQQISGWEQASLYPDTEAWAAPFTWLNTGLRLTRPLVPPVTGILGSTYPIDSTAEQAALGAQAKLGTELAAEVVGETGRERSLAGSDAQPFLLTAGMVGMVVNEAGTMHMRRRLQAC